MGETADECASFTTSMRNLDITIAILVTHSERFPHRLHDGHWAHHFWLDAASLGDKMCGSRNVFLREPIQLGCLRQPSYSGRPSSLEGLMSRAAPPPLADGNRKLRKRNIEHSHGVVREWENGQKSGPSIQFQRFIRSQRVWWGKSSFLIGR